MRAACAGSPAPRSTSPAGSPTPGRRGCSRARGRSSSPPPRRSGSPPSRRRPPGRRASPAPREEILEAARHYAELAGAEEEFLPGRTPVEIAGRVVGPPEIAALVDASLDGWLTEGRFAAEFVGAFAAAAGRAHAAIVGSGS